MRCMTKYNRPRALAGYVEDILEGLEGLKSACIEQRLEDIRNQLNFIGFSCSEALDFLEQLLELEDKDGPTNRTSKNGARSLD